MSARYIVVFKNSASSETISKQADEVSSNGGVVKDRFDSNVLKGFAAEIPDAYFAALQSNLQGTEINYIGELHTDASVSESLNPGGQLQSWILRSGLKLLDE
ncbi:hypothetical protein BC834DRAFT_969288 [Gloeopeniophorella convolvens]|nr:hypothetical protein BC834DRAFT_969288 [Gloeopeniophorella convolvens]